MNGLADDCYKFGAGRFVMRRGLLEEIGGELRYYGESPYFVGGPTALALARPRLQAGLAKAGMEGVFGVHAGQVCHEAARQKAQEARESGVLWYCVDYNMDYTHTKPFHDGYFYRIQV